MCIPWARSNLYKHVPKAELVRKLLRQCIHTCTKCLPMGVEAIWMVPPGAESFTALFRVTSAVLAAASCEMVRYLLKRFHCGFVRMMRMDWPRLYLKVLPCRTLSALEAILVQSFSVSGSKVSCTTCNIALRRRAEYQTCIMVGTAYLVSRKSAVISIIALRAPISRSISFMTMLKLSL
jgi:hypothetical protein